MTFITIIYIYITIISCFQHVNMLNKFLKKVTKKRCHLLAPRHQALPSALDNIGNIDSFSSHNILIVNIRTRVCVCVCMCVCASKHTYKTMDQVYIHQEKAGRHVLL